MNPRISNNMSVNNFAEVPSELERNTYIPALYQNGVDCYESKGKKTSRIIKSVTSIFNSVLLAAGVAIGGFFGFKWLKGSNLSFMSKPLEKHDFKNVTLKSEDIAGNEEQKKELKSIIDDCKSKKNADGTPKGCGVLLQGPPRCGKTLSANVYAKESGLTTFSCKTSSIISTVKGQTEKNVDKMFDQLRKQVKKDGKPVILIMDEIDSFLMKRDNATNEERAMVNAFLRNCDDLEKQGIIILGSTNYGDKCDTAAIGSGRFNKKISFDLPKAEDIKNMLKAKCKGESENDIAEISKFMAEHHMNWADAQNIIKEYLDKNDKIKYKEAMIYLIEKCQGNSTVQISSLIQENPPGAETLAWDDIYGLNEQKEKLLAWAEDPKKSSGYLLSGEPGCGKTTLPYALGKEKDCPVYTLRIGENGVTVDNLKSIIEDIKLEGLKRQLKEEKPLILFLDEAETMCGNRKGADLMHSISNSYEKTGTAIEAIQNLQESGVLCIAATNTPECVDAAMKRAGGRLNEMEIGMPTKDDVAKFIEVKYEKLKGKAGEIAGIFGNKNSKLSFANIKGILDEFVKTYGTGNYEKWSKELKQAINKKAKSMNAKPLESGLTQIGKALEEIQKAIKELKDEGVSAQLAEFKPYLENLAKLRNLDNLANLDNLKKLEQLKELAELKQLKELKEAIEKLKEEGIAAQLKKIDQHIGEHLAHLGKLDSLDSITSSLDAMRKALGDVKEDAAGGEKHTLLNMIETLCARLEGLQNLNKIEGLVKDINTNTAQNGELIKSVNTIVSALGITMENINQIADNTNSLMADYNELAKSVAEALKGVKDAVGDSAKANASLTAAIASLTDTQSQIQTLLGKIEDKLPEKKEGEGGETDPIQTMAENFTSLKETIETLISVVIMQNIKHIAEDVVGSLKYEKNIKIENILQKLSSLLQSKYKLPITRDDIRSRIGTGGILDKLKYYLNSNYQNTINNNHVYDADKKYHTTRFNNTLNVLNYYILDNTSNTDKDTFLDKLIENGYIMDITSLYDNVEDENVNNLLTTINNYINTSDRYKAFDITNGSKLWNLFDEDESDKIKNFCRQNQKEDTYPYILRCLLKKLLNSAQTKKLKESIYNQLNRVIIRSIQNLIMPDKN